MIGNGAEPPGVRDEAAFVQRSMMLLPSTLDGGPAQVLAASTARSALVIQAGLNKLRHYLSQAGFA
jgi:hypothetical protein